MREIKIRNIPYGKYTVWKKLTIPTYTFGLKRKKADYWLPLDEYGKTQSLGATYVPQFEEYEDAVKFLEWYEKEFEIK